MQRPTVIKGTCDECGAEFFGQGKKGLDGDYCSTFCFEKAEPDGNGEHGPRRDNANDSRTVATFPGGAGGVETTPSVGAQTDPPPERSSTLRTAFDDLLDDWRSDVDS